MDFVKIQFENPFPIVPTIQQSARLGQDAFL